MYICVMQLSLGDYRVLKHSRALEDRTFSPALATPFHSSLQKQRLAIPNIDESADKNNTSTKLTSTKMNF